MVKVFLGLGSNLGDSLNLLRQAVSKLQEHPDIHVTKQSSFYRSRPLAEMDQPDYFNMVIACETGLTAESLLDVTQDIETQCGRTRDGERWAARTLDIDILAYGQQIIKNKRLMVPHPGIVDRDFVLFPWREIAPMFQLPLLGSVESVAQHCEDRGLEMVSNTGESE